MYNAAKCDVIGEQQVASVISLRKWLVIMPFYLLVWFLWVRNAIVEQWTDRLSNAGLLRRVSIISWGLITYYTCFCEELICQKFLINTDQSKLIPHICITKHIYTAHKKFMNTSTRAESMASLVLEGRYLENQIWKAIEILNGFLSHGPLTEL